MFQVTIGSQSVHKMHMHYSMTSSRNLQQRALHLIHVLKAFFFILSFTILHFNLLLPGLTKLLRSYCLQKELLTDPHSVVIYVAATSL